MKQSTIIEADAVATVAHWTELVAALLTTESSRTILRNRIREMVRQGTIPTMQVIAAARDGHQDADYALRELAVEMLDNHDVLPSALAAYVQEALLRPPVSYPPGRNIADTWLRDIGIATLVSLAVERWHPDLPATRNSASKRLSACYLVSCALGRQGINVAEKRVAKIFGEHGKLAGKLSASMPAI